LIRQSFQGYPARALSSLHTGSDKITLTVPLRVNFRNAIIATINYPLRDSKKQKNEEMHFSKKKNFDISSE